MDSILELDIQSWIFFKVEHLTGFIGVLLFFGTIVGIFLDLLFHHRFLEYKKKEEVLTWLFIKKDDKEAIIQKRIHQTKVYHSLINYTQRKIDPVIKKDTISKDNVVFYSYFLPYIGIDNYLFLLKEYYYHSEFIANLGPTTIPFSVSIILILNSNWQLPYNPWLLYIMIIIAIIVGFYLTQICLRESIKTEQEYWDNFIHVTWGAIVKTANNEINKNKLGG
jgi:hypothetical protein